MDQVHLSAVHRLRRMTAQRSFIQRLSRRQLATVCVTAILSTGFGAASASAATSVPLSGNIAVSPSAPFIDVNTGTSVAISLSNSSFSSQDVVYVGLTDGTGAVTRRLPVTSGTADANGVVSSGTTSYIATSAGSQSYRVWIDLPDANGFRNRAYDSNEPTFVGSFNLAGNPASVILQDASGNPLGLSSQLTADTCRVFQAFVKDSNSVAISNQPLKLTFEAVPGTAPKACTSSDLTSAYQQAATSVSGTSILTGKSDSNGKILFAIKGGKGSPDWSGDMTATVLDSGALQSAKATVLISTNSGGNAAVSNIGTDFSTPVTRLSTSQVSLTATDKFGRPLQGVTLTQARVANLQVSPASGTDLPATDMLGKTTFTVDTSVLGDRIFIIWANKSGGTAGLDGTETSASATVTVIPQTVSTSKSTFVAANNVVPVDKARTALTLTLNDEQGFPVQDVQVDFTISSSGTGATLDSNSGVTAADGTVTINASRVATNVSRKTVEVTATVRNSNPAQSIKTSFEIQPRAASQITLISPKVKVSTVDKGTTQVTVALQDQFGGPFAGTVSFRSTAGRNRTDTASAANVVVTDAQGQAKVNFSDVIGRLTSPTNDSFDTVIAEATTVDSVTITSNPVNISYTPSIKGNKMTVSNLPSTYALLYGATSSQDLLTANVLVQNITGSAINTLYATSVVATISGPANLLDGAGRVVNSLSLVSDDNGQFTVSLRATGLVGDVTLTLTSGTDSKTASFKVVADSAAARIITTSASSSSLKSGAPVRVTAKATDVFGNALPGVQIQFLSSGIGRLNAASSLAGLCAVNGIGTSQQAFGVVLNTDSDGTAYVDLLTSSYEAGTATVYAYLGNSSPFVTPCGTAYPEASQLVDRPFVGAPAGKASSGVNVAFALDTSMVDLAKQAAADKASAQALATQAAADKASAQALASQAAADKASAQALATQSASDKAAAQALATQAAADKVAAQALATQAAADKAAAQALATQAAADKTAADKAKAQAAADKAKALSVLTKANDTMKAAKKVMAQALALLKKKA